MSLLSQQLARLRWQCRRGMLELDLLLLPYLENRFTRSTEADQLLFAELLTHTDQDLYAWLVKNEKPQDDRFITLIHLIRNHAAD